MMTLRRRVLVVVASALCLLVAGGSAWAFFTTGGSGSGSATVGSLTAPSAVTGTPSGNTVSLSWTAAVPPAGQSLNGYYVQRSTGTAAGTCSSSGTLLLAASATGCSDTGVPAATYTYNVVAVFRSWTASATSGSVTVAPGVLDHFQVTAPAGATAGSSFNVTVTAKDASNATFTSYTGTQALVWSGAGTAPSGAAPTFPSSVVFTNGVGTASVTLVKAETTTLTVSQAAKTGTSGSVVVSGGVATQFAIAATTPQTAGTAFTITLTARDAFRNAATGYSGAKTLVWSGAGTAPSGATPTYQPNVVFSTGGVASASTILVNVETATLTATEGTITGTSNGIVVNHGAASRFALSATTSPTAGAAFTVGLTAQDAFRNTATTYAGSQTIVWSGPASSPSGALPTNGTPVNFTAGVGSASVTLVKAETVTLTATQGTTTGSLPGIVVNTGAAARLAWTQVAVSKGTLSLPCLFSCTDTNINNGTFTARVAVTDSQGNTLTGLGTGHTVTVSTPASGPGSGGAFTSPTAGTSVTLAIASSGPAESTATFTFTAQNGSWTSDTFKAATLVGTAYTDATATVTR